MLKHLTAAVYGHLAGTPFNQPRLAICEPRAARPRAARRPPLKSVVLNSDNATESMCPRACNTNTDTNANNQSNSNSNSNINSNSSSTTTATATATTTTTTTTTTTDNY